MPAQRAIERPGTMSAVAPSRDWTALFRFEWKRLQGYLARRNSRQDAEDIAQEAFARVFAAGDRVRHPSGVLYETARNLSIDGRRRREREAEMFGPWLEDVRDPAPSPEDRAHWRRELDDVAHVLAAMSAKRRAVFMLRVVEGLGHTEIAARLSLSRVAVEKHLLRAYALCLEIRERRAAGD